MPLFGWVKRPRRRPHRPTRCPSPEGTARTLLRELQWHLEERERSLQEMENGPQVGRTGADLRWPRSCRTPRTSIPAAELRQLEALCSRVQPHQTGAVLSRFREVLADTDVLPWEIVGLFKQVLEDALGRDGGQPGGPAAGGTGGPTRPARPGRCARSAYRDEIPTVSSYVDRNREGSLPTLPGGARSPPCYPRP